MDHNYWGCQIVNGKGLLTVNCQTTDHGNQKRQISKKTKQDKSKPKHNSEDNLYTNKKVNLEVDNFVVGPNTAKWIGLHMLKLQ